MSTPIDRASLLRRRFVVLSGVAATAVVAVAVPATALSGLPWTVVAASCAAVAVAGVGVVAVAAASQKRGRAESRWLLRLLLVLTWVGLLALALDESPSFRGGPAAGVAWTSLVIVGVAVIPLVVTGWRGLARLQRRQLEPGGNLSSGLSGALATLDLALAYDVVVAHTARKRGTVRSRRGGPHGPLALVWRDVIRLRRRPMPLVVVAAVVVAPYAVAQAGGGRLTVLVATLVGFVGAVPLCLALRVVTRTPALARMMPFTNAMARGCTLVVPGVVLAAFGLASSPALGAAMGVDGGVATQMGLSVGFGALTSTAWWMAARPVNYALPAVSTPMGALPPGMISGALRGPDMVLVTSAPMLVSPTATGAAVTFWLCAAVVAYLVLRR